MSTRFTVIIPTRERCDTLEWTLKTCTTQDYDNLEIIVSDNDSADRTKEVVDSFSDSRIRYLNTGHRVSMSENFEFALSHARGEYIGCIGDDDGLLPDALKDLDPIIQQFRCQAIVWPMQNYYWPGFFEPQLANTLSMSLRQRDVIREVASSAILREIAKFRIRYHSLPSIYFGFVNYTAVQAVIERSGKFFCSINPDVYAGVAVASLLDSYHISSRAFSLSGQSKHSNGASNMGGRTNTNSQVESARFKQENTIPFHEDLVQAPSLPIHVAEAFLQVRDHLGYSDKTALDMQDVIRAALVEQNYLFNPDLQDEVIYAIRTIASRHGLETYAEHMIRHAEIWRYPRMCREVAKLILIYNPVFDCSRYGVKNVYDASLLFKHLVQRYQSPSARQLATVLARINKAKRIVDTGRARMIDRQATN